MMADAHHTDMRLERSKSERYEKKRIENHCRKKGMKREEKRCQIHDIPSYDAVYTQDSHSSTFCEFCDAFRKQIDATRWAARGR